MAAITLNEKQQQAVSHFEGPMVVLSVAGSGKTHVLTERIVHLIQEHSVHPANLLAITFAKKAAHEMLDRLACKLNGSSGRLTVCTFHSLGYRILKENRFPVNGFKVIQSGSQMELFCRAIQETGVLDEPTGLLARMSMARSGLVSVQELSASENQGDQTLAVVYRQYELLKRREHVVDYDDLLCLPYQLFNKDPALLRHYQQRFRFILVDEFQDSSRVMVELLRLLTDDHRNLWACGDDDQVIHEFRGAAPDVFVSLGRYYGRDLQMVTMDENYRSSQNILKAANRLIAHNGTRVRKEMKTRNGDGEPVRMLEAPDELSEAALIVEEVFRLNGKQVPCGEIAILVRMHRIMPLIEAALIRAGLPYESRNGLLSRSEVKAALKVMKYLLTEETPDGLEVQRIDRLRAELFPEGGALSLKDAFDVARSHVLTAFFHPVIEEEPGLAPVCLDAFGEVVSEYVDLAGLLSGLDSLKPHGEKGVQLLTIHQAKGLEFEAVIVPGLNEGILPHVRSLETGSGIEEERRLLYVAMTRARSHLTITWRRGQGLLPSRFIWEMQDHP